MSQPTPIRERQIDAPEIAAFLVNRTSIRYLHPFMHHERSLGEAARFLEISKSRMGYWLKKLLEMELIRLIRIEKRGKHRVPIYTATAEVFIMPIELVQPEADENLLNEHARDFERSAKRSLLHTAHMSSDHWDVRFSFVDGTGKLDVVPVGDDIEEIVNHWGRLQFSAPQARAFRQELLDLIERFERASSGEGKRYLYKLMLVEESVD
jgi:DNA-binding transcriptional ArsR family regulator